MNKRIVILTLAVLTLASFSLAADLNGRWIGKIGNDEVALNLKAEGKKLSGTIYTPDGEGPIANGKISGSDFSFTYSTNGYVIPYTGKLDGDKVEIFSSIVKGKEQKGTLSRMQESDPLRIAPRIKPEMSEYWEPVPKIVDPGPYLGMYLLLLMPLFSLMVKIYPSGKAVMEVKPNGKLKVAALPL